MPPHIADNGTEADTLQILRELNRAKVAFQLRSIGTVLGVPDRPTDEQDWRRGVCNRVIRNHFFALSQTGAPVSQHIGDEPIGDGVAAKR